MARACRLMAIHDLLCEVALTTREMAERFHVSEQTICRDLRDLQAEPLRRPLVRENRWRILRTVSD